MSGSKGCCEICTRSVAINHRSILCQVCNKHVHIKCNQTDAKTFENINRNKIPQTCLKCQVKILPFQDLSDTQFSAENQNLILPPSIAGKPQCKICTKTIAKNHRKISCQACSSDVHFKCNQTDVKTYNKILKENLPQTCLSCQNPHTKSITQKSSCGVCTKTIAKNHRNIYCDLCNCRVHIKCNKTDVKTYNNVIKENKKVTCISCQLENIPFQSLTDIEFSAVNKGLDTDTDILQEVCVTSTSLKIFFEEINKSNPFTNVNDDENDDNATLINCKYVDLASFNFKPSKEKFSLFHTNIGSLAKHKEELETTLTMLDYKFDIIGITETKLTRKTKPKIDINLNGYKCYHVDTDAEKGGSLIYVSENISSKERTDLELLLYKSEVLESTFIEISNKHKKNIIIGCIYRHPSMDLKEFNDDYLIPFMESFNKEDKKKYLIGDFNVDLLKIDEDSKSSNYFDTMTSNLFVPHITIPTRITSRSKTLIDNIFSNCNNYEEGISGNITVSLSDHLAQFLIIPDECHHAENKQNQFTRDMKNFDEEKFISELLEIEWSTLLQLNKDDPNISFEIFHSKIDNLINKYLPLRKMTKKEIKQGYKPWISNEIIKLIQQRNKLHKQFINANNEEVKILFHTRYKSVRNQVVSICRQSKKEYYRNYFTENSHNLRNTWRGIKTIIHLDKKDKCHPSSLIINDELSNDPMKIANAFNGYFSKIASKLQSSAHTQGQNFNDYLQKPSEKNFFITPTTKYEIIDMISNSINTNKACGPNSIPNKMFHLIKQVIAEPLADIINLSFTTGIYIDKLKVAKVIPIYKEKGDKLFTENFRPISLLSNINKIFEKIMHKRLYNFLEEQGIIYDNQFGFRKKHSTTHALLDLTEEIRNTIDNNRFSCGVFIDLQKAFDTVDHSILLRKLEYYGIRGITNDWFCSYLTNRKQYVSISGFESETANMDFGVPQGSVLGPLLFLIYINDLHKAIKYSKTRHFADDTNLLIENNSLKQLQKQLNYDLRQLSNWLKANKISLNCSKTELILFRHPNKPINYDLRVKINGKKLIASNYVKYLGIYLDSHLNWSYHVDCLSTKLTRASGMLSKIRHYVSATTLRNIYFGIFSSLLTYGCQIWGQFKNKHISRLQQIQNRAIRIINFADFRDSPDPLYSKSNLLIMSNFKIFTMFTTH